MNKKCLVILLVLALALTGLCAKDSGFKVGGQLGWGFDYGKMKTVAEDDTTTYTSKNNGFALNLTGEYDFNKNWAVRANLGMMLAGKASCAFKTDAFNAGKRSGLYIDFALDGKYTFVINEKVSLSALSGLEVVAGYLAKDIKEGLGGCALASSESSYSDSNFYNVAFGVNLGLEGSYKLTDKISIVGGATGSWLFVNSSKFVATVKKAVEGDSGTKFSAASFYIRPYVGAQYAF